jgi:hypothetical protein
MSYAFFELIVAISADTAIAVSWALQRHWFISSMRNTFGSSEEAKEVMERMKGNRTLAPSLTFVTVDFQEPKES